MIIVEYQDSSRFESWRDLFFFLPILSWLDHFYAYTGNTTGKKYSEKHMILSSCLQETARHFVSFLTDATVRCLNNLRTGTSSAQITRKQRITCHCYDHEAKEKEELFYLILISCITALFRCVLFKWNYSIYELTKFLTFWPELQKINKKLKSQRQQKHLAR